MKKLVILIILAVISPVHAQTADEKETLTKLNENVIALYKIQKYDEALKSAQQALDLSLKINGENVDETAAAYKILGVVYREKSKYKISAENLQKAFEIYRRKPQPNARNLFEIYNLLALSQSLGGMRKEAEANYLKAIEVAETIFGRDAKENLKPVSALAVFYAQDDNVEKSHEYYLKSYALALKYFGEKSGEVEALKIYEAYYSRRVILKKDKQNDEYSRKKAELFGYETASVINLLQPAYSDRARAEKRQGKIVVKVSVDEQGKATDVKAVYGEMFFASSVEESARNSKYEPAITNGKPISSTVYIRYNFVNSN